MSVLARIKRKLANVIAARPAIHRRVIDVMLSDDAATDQLAARLLTSKRAIGRLLQNRGFFEQVLTRLSSNPEALFQILSRSDVSRQLTAQTSVLARLASNPKSLNTVLTEAPPDMLSVAFAGFLKSQKRRSELSGMLAGDKASVIQLLVLSAALLEDENRPSARLRVLIEALAKEPVFRLALHQDAEFRALLLEIVESGFASVGEVPFKASPVLESAVP